MKPKEITITIKSKAKNLLQDERGVSTVIGFVLIIGIVIAASTIYFSSQVPNWSKDFEALHTGEVADDFAEQKSLVDGIVLNKGESELAGGATPIKMSPDKVPILGMSPPGSNLIFNHQDEKFEVVVPTAGGGGGETKTWEQNATTGFLYKDAYHVDTSSKEVKLARYAPEGDLIVDGDTTWLDGEHSYDRVIITNSGILYVYGFLEIHANSITVDSSSKIIADGKGLSGGTSEKDGDGGDGGGKTGDSEGDGGGGAGYGASGGDGYDNPNSGGDSYGNPTSNASIKMGSGGGGGCPGTAAVGAGGTGGNGGGAIWLDAEEINIVGTISADGEDGLSGSATTTGAGGGGSGGGILITGRNVTISDTLSAKGGDGGDSKGGGGGGGAGGRIKIFYGSGTVSIPSESDDSDIKGNNASGKDGGAGGNAWVYKRQEDYTSSITHYSSGYLVSEVYNTTSESTCYDEMTWNADLNGQTLVMKVRTDMFEDMRSAPDWPYCPAVSNGSDISSLSSVSDGHCYVQYCAELSTKDDTTTPVLHRVKINYSSSAGNPIVATSSGAIKFQSNYLYYPNQQIVYEHGAVIKYQSEGGFMLQSPPIFISNESGIPTLRITLVNLTGANRSYSGGTSTSLKNTYKSYNLLVNNLKYPNLAINLTTEYPSVWGKWFNKTLEETTLTTPYHYVVSVDDAAAAKTVTVEFYGNGDGVELYLEKTVVEVEI